MFNLSYKFFLGYHYYVKQRISPPVLQDEILDLSVE